jgi:hypothetical protein
MRTEKTKKLLVALREAEARKDAKEAIRFALRIHAVIHRPQPAAII